MAGTLSRPSRSLTSSGRRSVTRTRPEVMSSTSGSTLTSTGCVCSSLRTRRRSRWRSLGSAISTSRTLWRSMSSPKRSGVVHLHARHVLPQYRLVGVDERDGVAVIGAAQRGEKLHAEPARAEDDDGLAVHVDGKLGQADAGALQEDRVDLAARGDEQRRQHAVAEHGRARDAELAEHEHEQRPHQHRQPDAADDARVAAVAEVARHEPVEARHGEDGDRDQRRAGKQQPRHPVRARRACCSEARWGTRARSSGAEGRGRPGSRAC